MNPWSRGEAAFGWGPITPTFPRPATLCFACWAPVGTRAYYSRNSPPANVNVGLDLETLDTSPGRTLSVERGALRCDWFPMVESPFWRDGCSGADGGFSCCLSVPFQALPWRLSIRPDLPTFAPLIPRMSTGRTGTWVISFSCPGGPVPSPPDG